MTTDDDKTRESHNLLLDDASVLTEDPLDHPSADDELTQAQAWCMYLSHFLSMWNSRIYEYGAVLFAQHTWPGGLLPSAIIGISETICVLFSSTAIGRWIDSSPTRLRPLIVSIVANRVTLVINCALWLLIFSTDKAWLQQAFFGVILVLGMVEKTTRMSNMLSFERDWVPTVASYPSKDDSCGAYDLTHLNTVVRRIDITCKFLAPLAASGSMSIFSPGTVTVMIATVSLVSVCIEIPAALRVWRQNYRLRAPKLYLKQHYILHPPNPGVRMGISQRIFVSLLRSASWLVSVVNSQIEGFRYYFSTDVWVPSIGVAILHASVLAWAGTLVTYLLNGGFSYAEVTAAKAVGSVFEIGSTFIFPWAVWFFSRRVALPGRQQGSYELVSTTTDKDEPEEDHPASHAPVLHNDTSIIEESLAFSQPLQDPHTLQPIVQTGKWAIVSLCANLIPTVIALFLLDTVISPPGNPSDGVSAHPTSSSAFSTAPIASTLFFAFLSLSFLGRWTYDLSVTQLTQTLIPAARRSEFGGAEMAAVALLSFSHWLATAIWHLQADFKWLAAGSLGAVSVATVAYVAWVRGWERWLAAGV